MTKPLLRAAGIDFLAHFNEHIPNLLPSQSDVCKCVCIFKTVDKRENTCSATADDGWSKIIALQPEAQNGN